MRLPTVIRGVDWKYALGCSQRQPYSVNVFTIILIAIVIGHRSKRLFGFVFVCSIYERRKNCVRLFIFCGCSIFYVYPKHTARVTCSSATFISSSQRVQQKMKWGKKDNHIADTDTNASSRQAGKLSGRPENIQPWTMIDRPWQFNSSPPDRADSFAFHFICIGFNAIGDATGLFLATQTDTHTRPEQCDLDAIISYLYNLFWEAKHAR